MNFKLNIDSNLSETANKDAASLEALQATLRAEEQALGAMEKQMRALQKASSVDVATFKKLDAAIGSQRDKVAGLTAKMVSLGDAGLKPVAKGAGDLSRGMEQLAARQGPVGAFLSKLGPWGIAAGVALGGLLVTVGLLTVGFSKMASLAQQFSEGRGDAERMLQTVFQSEEAAKNTYDAITNVTRTVAISQEKAIEVAESLTRAGRMSGNEMVRAVESIGKAEAARKGAGDAIQGIIERAEKSRQWGNGGFFAVGMQELRNAGINYGDLAKTLAKQTGVGLQEATNALYTGRVRVAAGLQALNATIDEKLGPLADQKFMTMGAASNRLKDTFGRLFDSLDTTPIARVMDKFARFFDASTMSGHTLKIVLTKIWDGISSAIDKVAPYAEVFFKGLLLIGMKVYNGLYPLRQRINDLFGGDGEQSLTSFGDMMIWVADKAGEMASFIADNAVPIAITAFALLTPVIWSAVTAVASLAAGVVVATWPFIAIGAAVFGFVKLVQMAMNTDWGYLWDKLKESMSELLGYVSEFGGNIISGLVNGVMAGAGKFVDAIKGVAGQGIGAFKSAFGIASPSKVMQVQGRHLPEGAAIGVEDGEEDVSRAIGGLGKGAQLGTAHTSVTNNRSSGGQMSVTFAEGAIQINGVKDAEQLKGEMPQIMADIFEQLGLSMGAEVPA